MHQYDFYNDIAKDICQSDRAKAIANQVGPAVVGSTVAVVTGNPLMGTAASTTARVVAESAPDGTAEFFTTLGVAVAAPVVTVGVIAFGIGCLGLKAARGFFDLFD